MDLSIIIVNYNTKALLLRCIETIVRHGGLTSFSYEMIVVDNGSADGSVESVKCQVSSIKNKKINFKVIQNKENTGFGRANNQAAKQAKGEYIIFLNTDIEVHENALTKLLTFAKEQQKPTIIGSKLYNKDGTEQASCGPFYGLLATFVMLFLQGDRLGITRYSPSRLREVDWVSGACFLVKKNDFTALGGFDERIFIYMEEVELSFRAKQKGMRVIFYSHAHFTHLGAATSSKNTDSSPIVTIYRGLLYMYQMHHSTFSLTMLKLMLKVKAICAITVGKLTNNQHLTKTNEKAYQLLG